MTNPLKPSPPQNKKVATLPEPHLTFESNSARFLTLPPVCLKVHRGLCKAVLGKNL